MRNAVTAVGVLVVLGVSLVAAQPLTCIPLGRSCQSRNKWNPLGASSKCCGDPKRVYCVYSFTRYRHLCTMIQRLGRRPSPLPIAERPSPSPRPRNRFSGGRRRRRRRRQTSLSLKPKTKTIPNPPPKPVAFKPKPAPAPTRRPPSKPVSAPVTLKPRVKPAPKPTRNVRRTPTKPAAVKRQQPKPAPKPKRKNPTTLGLSGSRRGKSGVRRTPPKPAPKPKRKPAFRPKRTKPAPKPQPKKPAFPKRKPRNCIPRFNHCGFSKLNKFSSNKRCCGFNLCIYVSAGVYKCLPQSYLFNAAKRFEGLNR